MHNKKQANKASSNVCSVTFCQPINIIKPCILIDQGDINAFFDLFVVFTLHFYGFPRQLLRNHAGLRKTTDNSSGFPPLAHCRSLYVSLSLASMTFHFQIKRFGVRKFDFIWAQCRIKSVTLSNRILFQSQNVFTCPSILHRAKASHRLKTMC